MGTAISALMKSPNTSVRANSCYVRVPQLATSQKIHKVDLRVLGSEAALAQLARLLTKPVISLNSA